MYVIPQALTDALRSGDGVEVIESYAELWAGVPRTRVATVELSGGSVTGALTGAVRWSCSAGLPTLDGVTLDAEVIGSDRRFGDGTFGSGTFGDYKRAVLRGALQPLLTEIRLFWRARVLGTWYSVPMGRFVVDQPEFADSSDGQGVTVTGLDYASDVAAAAWDTTFVVAEGTNVRTALTSIIASRDGAQTISTNIPTTSHTTPQLIFTPGAEDNNAGSTPWDDAASLARVAGWDLWTSRTGVVTAGVPANPLTASPVWTFEDVKGIDQIKQTPSAADLVNTVVVYGENSGTDPIVVVVRDTDGPYGVNTLGRVRAREYRSSDIKNETQALNAGIVMLRQWGALTETISFQSWPVPHLDPGDPVRVVDSELDIDGTYLVENIVTSLDPANPWSQVTVSRRAG